GVGAINRIAPDGQAVLDHILPVPPALEKEKACSPETAQGSGAGQEDLPAKTGSSPKALDRFPKALDRFPEKTGSFPRELGSFPKKMGSFPRELGSFPRELGSFRQSVPSRRYAPRSASSASAWQRTSPAATTSPLL